MTITVIIPTYHRPKSLARCLEALRNQVRPADEILVVVRDTDLETKDFLKSMNYESLDLKVIETTVPGQVVAWNAGLEKARGDIIAFTDDDAAPHIDWLACIEKHFLSDPNIGGVGGRDIIYHGEDTESDEKMVVGKVTWFGHIIGNHHLGIGSPREVDHLKGVNMSFHRKAINKIRFNRNLRGVGAQLRNDTAFSLAVKRAGWKLIYDSAIKVDHYDLDRVGETRVHSFTANLKDVYDAAYNDGLIMFEYLSFCRCIAYIFWSIFVGTRVMPGVIQAIRFMPKYKVWAWERFIVVQRGKLSVLLKLYLEKE